MIDTKVSFLRETLLLEAETTTFKQKSNGGMTVTGIFQKGDTPNANKRVYPMQYLNRETERLLPLCKAKALVGELDHPFYPDEAESAIIHAGNTSHVITNLWVEDNLLYGELEILDTPAGKILQEFVKKGVQIGVSSRSLGGVREAPNGFYYVDDTLKILTWDAVVGPSVVESKLKENAVHQYAESYRSWNAKAENASLLKEWLSGNTSVKMPRVIKEALEEAPVAPETESPDAELLTRVLRGEVVKELRKH